MAQGIWRFTGNPRESGVHLVVAHGIRFGSFSLTSGLRFIVFSARRSKCSQFVWVRSYTADLVYLTVCFQPPGSHASLRRSPVVFSRTFSNSCAQTASSCRYISPVSYLEFHLPEKSYLIMW